MTLSCTISDAKVEERGGDRGAGRMDGSLSLIVVEGVGCGRLVEAAGGEKE